MVSLEKDFRDKEALFETTYSVAEKGPVAKYHTLLWVVATVNITFKFFTMVINTRLTDFLESNDLLVEEQAGFRAGYSTLDHIFSLHCLIDLHLNNKKRLYCAFLGYKKAFNMVTDALYGRNYYPSIGIHGKILTITKTMYANPKSCVQLDSDLTDFFICNIGVRQGENISPLLFSIFLNDLAIFMSDKTKDGTTIT